MFLHVQAQTILLASFWGQLYLLMWFFGETWRAARDMWNDGTAYSGHVIWSDGDATIFDPGTGTFLSSSWKSDILQIIALLNGNVRLFKQAENHSFQELGLPCLAVECRVPGGGQTRDGSSWEQGGAGRPKSLWSSCVKRNINSFILLFSCTNHLLIAKKWKGNTWM